MISLEPKLKANGMEHRCGHNFPPEKCPYEKCDLRLFKQYICVLHSKLDAQDAEIFRLRKLTWGAYRVTANQA